LSECRWFSLTFIDIIIILLFNCTVAIENCYFVSRRFVSLDDSQESSKISCVFCRNMHAVQFMSTAPQFSMLFLFKINNEPRFYYISIFKFIYVLYLIFDLSICNRISAIFQMYFIIKYNVFNKYFINVTTTGINTLMLIKLTWDAR
jgi:hypothetical protein